MASLLFKQKLAKYIEEMEHNIKTITDEIAKAETELKKTKRTKFGWETRLNQMQADLRLYEESDI